MIIFTQERVGSLRRMRREKENMRVVDAKMRP
jgi:hypothetical protein